MNLVLSEIKSEIEIYSRSIKSLENILVAKRNVLENLHKSKKYLESRNEK